MIIRRIALAVVSLLVLFAVFEGGLRAREAGQRRKILAGRSVADLGTVRAEPPLLYTLKPGWKGQFNSHGFRDVERSKVKKDGDFRLAVVGDSVTMQVDIPFDKLYARRLERMLREAFPDSSIECPVFAVTGYCGAQELVVMRDTVLDFDPDAILWQIHLNDASDPVIDGDNGGLGRYYSRPRSQAWATLRRKADHLQRTFFVQRHHPDLEQRDLQMQAWHWDHMGTVIERVRELSVSSGVPVFVVVFPSFPEGGDWGRYSEADMRLYDAIVNRFRDTGFPALDLMPEFKEYPVAEIQRDPGDLWHPNARGHGIMARVISQWLIDEDFQAGSISSSPPM